MSLSPDEIPRGSLCPDTLMMLTPPARILPAYSPAYVMDICRTDDGLRLLETNCINAAGFYASDVVRLASAIDALA